jgi:endonuclease III
MLSGRTPERRYLVTFRELRNRYPAWVDLLNAPTEELESIIRYCGLEKRKAADLKVVLIKVRQEFGQLSLDELMNQDNQEAEAFLTSLPGVGLKSARCILMYSLDREVFPVDVHVWRVFKRLGLIKGGRVPTSRQANDAQALVPPELRYTLHVNLVAHGREICRPKHPSCERCPILQHCPSGKARVGQPEGSLSERLIN